MERIGIVGLSWRQGGTEALARFTIPVDNRVGRLPDLADEIGVAELVYVATCNRVEVVLIGDGSTTMDEYRTRVYEALLGERSFGAARKALRAWVGEGAAEHLFLVASGLDSARPGETEIIAQIKAAVTLSRELGLLGSRLGRLFEDAVRVSRRVHSETAIGSGKVSLSTLATDHLRERLTQSRGGVALVGVTDMIRNAAAEFAGEDQEVHIVNRTTSRAVELAEEFGATAWSLVDFANRPPAVEAVLVSTGSPDPVLRTAELERIGAASRDGNPLIVDLSVPPNVLPEEAAAAGVRRIGMDEIIDEATVNREHRLAEMAGARICVDEALEDLRHWIAKRNVDPMVVELRARYRREARSQVDRLLNRKLQGLDVTQREELRRWADSFARRLAHIPLIGLRSLAAEKGADVVEAFFEGADENLARGIRRAAERSGYAPEADDWE